MKSIKLVWAFSLVLLSCNTLAAQLLRSPSIQGDTLVFRYANDIWKTSISGGEATRLTSFQGIEANPKISPDGKWVAFAGEYNGRYDVFVVSIDGGDSQRLTYHPASDMVVDWAPDSKSILFSSTRSNAPRGWPRLYSISIEGGNPTRLPMNRAFNGAYSPDGKEVVYRRAGFWDRGWRNYRGGQNQALRVIDLASLEEYDLPFDNDFDLDPIWRGDDIYFLSNRSKVANVFKYSVRSKDITQVTKATKFDVMSFDIDGNNMVHEYHGDLYLTRGNGSPQKIDVSINADFYWSRDEFVDVSRNIGGFDLSPNAKRAVFEARGDIFTVPVENGSPRALTNTSGERELSPAWSDDGQSIAWFTDRSGEYRLVIADQFGEEKQEIILAEKGFYSELAWSPDGKYVSFNDQLQQLWLVNVDDKSTKIIDQNVVTHPDFRLMAVWSPDSKWIAYTNQTSNMFRQLHAYSIDSGEKLTLSEGIVEVRYPAWDKNGERLYFLASIDYGPKAAWLDMSTVGFNPTYQVYYALLNDELDSPHLLKSDEEDIVKEETDSGAEEDEAEDSEKAEEETVTVKLSKNGFMDRVMPLSLEKGHFTNLQAGKSGDIYYLSHYQDHSGSTKTDLIRYDGEKQKTKSIAKEVRSYTMSKDGDSILANMGSSWKVFSSSKGSGGDDKTLNVNLQKFVDYSEEWQQIFREAWRFQRDYFYVDNFHGADWNDVYESYKPLVESVKHPADLTYLLDNLGAEISVGHSYTSTGKLPDGGRNIVGLLGADYEVSGDGVKLSKVYTGEQFFAGQNHNAPLAHVAHQINAGDYLVEINGKPVDASENLYKYFQGTVGNHVEIAIASDKDSEPKRFTVKPVRSELSLRRNDWVESNRKYVEEKSDGKLAYVWVPNTADDGYHTFNRYFFSQSDRQGVIIDERFNHGGYIADYVIDILRRELNGFFNNQFAQDKPMTSPGSGVWGTQVMLINEVAGSGGDMLPYMFRHYELGTLIGKRTWGGLVGIWGVPGLIDGGYITAPRSGFYDLNGEWKVENEGVAPDIEVEQWTKYTAKGIDPQLDRAIEEAMKGLENYQSPIVPQPKPPLRVPNPVR